MLFLFFDYIKFVYTERLSIERVFTGFPLKFDIINLNFDIVNLKFVNVSFNVDIVSFDFVIVDLNAITVVWIDVFVVAMVVGV